MKNSKGSFLSAAPVVSRALFLLLFILISNACERDTDVVQSRYSGARNGSNGPITNAPCPPGYNYDPNGGGCVPNGGPVDCSPVNNIVSTERNRVVNGYGQDAGTFYDQLASASAPNYSNQTQTYINQIHYALSQAGGDLWSSGCESCANDVYNSGVLYHAFETRLNPVKNSVMNDGTLSVLDKTALLSAIQAVFDNFNEVTSLAEGYHSCFQNPDWYGSTDNLDGGYDGPYTDGFFTGLGKIVKKIVQIVVTVVTNIVDYAMLGAVVGSAVPGIGTNLGILIGGLFGLGRGIVRSAQGQYSCIVGWCV